jgi:hypothetical protein
LHFFRSHAVKGDRLLFRANLVKKAEERPYGSLTERKSKNRDLLNETYMTLYDDWTAFVNEPIQKNNLAEIRNSVNRQSPLGEAE